MRKLLVRSLLIFLVLFTSVLTPTASDVSPVSAAVQTLHSFYFSGIRPGGMFQESDVAVTRTLALNSLSQVTLEAWVKRVDATRSETVVCNDHSFSYCLGFSGSKVFFTTNGALSQVLSTGSVGANYWVHIAGTYANNVSQIYINGILDTSAANTQGIGPAIVGSFGIGADLGTDYQQNYFEGWIDTVRLWNVARSGADIRATMFEELGGTDPNLVSEWRLNGDASDSAGSNPGTAVGPHYVTDGALPHDLRIPLVSSAPTLDGACGADTEYNDAVQVTDSSTQPPGTSVYLERTATDLWVCFDQLTPPTWNGDNWAAVYLDPNYSRDALAQPTDFSLEMHHDGSRRTRTGNASGDYTATSAYDSQWDGRYLTTNDGFNNHYFAEFRISNTLINATSQTKTIGLALAQHWIGQTGDDRLWPALAGYNSPATWSAATLNGVGPARTFTGHVYYTPQFSSAATGIPGVSVQLIGFDPNTNTEAFTGTTQTLADGSFSLTSNDDYPNHRLGIDPNTFPKGYMPLGASGPPPASFFSNSVLDFHTAVGGTYASIVFKITDVRPGLIDASNAPYFLIVAPQADIDYGVLNDFVDYKQRIGFKVEVVSIETAIANYNGANTVQHIRSLEVNRYFQYGPRFGYVLLVGSDQTLPFGRIDAGTVLPNDCKVFGAGWPTDWFYADLTSNWDTNGNGCWGDGIFGDPSDQAKNNYTPDSRNVYHLTVAVGRLPFDNPNTVRSALANSMAFEKSSLDVKRQALLSMSTMGLNGQCWDVKQKKYNTCNDGTADGSYLGQAMLNNILTPNAFQVYRTYENQPVKVGGVPTGASGVMTALQDTYQNLKNELGAKAYGLVAPTGHGFGEGVVRTYWAGDANGDGLIDNPTAPFPPNNQPVYELQQPEMFDTGSLPARAGEAPVFLITACSTGEFDDPNSLGAALLSSGQGTAWVGGTGVVPYSPNWQAPGGGGMQDITYNIASRMLNSNQRLGDAVWGTMSVYMANALQVPRSGWWAQDFDLYGDPTLSYWGDAGGQASLAPWPMLRADPYGHGATTLIGPATPTQLWTYPALARVLDSLPPSPAVAYNNDVVIAQGNFIDVVRAGVQTARLTLTAPDYGSPAIAADGTLYALDRGGKLYAFGCGSNLSCSYSLHWTLDLGSHPLTSPVIGPDGLVAIGHEGADTAHSLIALVRSDGFLYRDEALNGQPVGELAVGGDRVVYAATDTGLLAAYDTTCKVGFCTRYDSLLGGPAYTTPPLLYLDEIFAGRADGSVVVKNAATLATLHVFTANGAVVSGPIVTPGGSIVVGTDAGTLYALSTGMTERWHANLGAALVSMPAASASDIYIASGDYLYAYEPYSGNIDWLAYLGAGANGGSAAIGYGRQVLVQTRNGPLVDIADHWTPPNPWLLASSVILANPAGGPGTKAMALSWATAALPGAPGATTAASPLGYRIQRRAAAGPWQDLVFLAAGTTSYNDDTVQEGVLYDYRIQTLDPQGNDSDFTGLSAPLDSLPAAPGAPSLQPVAPQSATSLQLTWTASSAAGAGLASSYRVERGASAAGPFSPLATLTGGSAGFTDTGLAPNATWYYRVVAINAGGESSPSGVQGGTTFSQTLPAPQNVAATRLDPYHVRISWDPGPVGVQAVIEVNVLGQATFQTAGTAGNAGPFTDLEMNPNSYAYRVKFVQGSNESRYSLATLRVTLATFNYLYLPVVRK